MFEPFVLRWGLLAPHSRMSASFTPTVSFQGLRETQLQLKVGHWFPATWGAFQQLCLPLLKLGKLGCFSEVARSGPHVGPWQKDWV